jgi:hypothetical protein
MDWSVIVASVITLAGTVLTAIVGRYLINKREARKCPISTDTENSENVYVSLEYLMDESNSDRVYIMQFHNGGHYISGKNQQKFSCTHEICAKGISRECESSQNHLVSNYSLYIKSLLKDGVFSHINLDSIKDKSFKNVLYATGVGSIYNVPLKTLEGKLIGVLGVDYVKDPPRMEIFDKFKNIKTEKELYEFMRRQARLITGYLI